MKIFPVFYFQSSGEKVKFGTKVPIMVVLNEGSPDPFLEIQGLGGQL